MHGNSVQVLGPSRNRDPWIFAPHWDYSQFALGRSNGLFAESLRAGQRAAAISLIQSAKLNGHHPYRYLKDVIERLPTQPASRLDELMPHRWSPAPADP